MSFTHRYTARPDPSVRNVDPDAVAVVIVVPPDAFPVADAPVADAPVLGALVLLLLLAHADTSRAVATPATSAAPILSPGDTSAATARSRAPILAALLLVGAAFFAVARWLILVFSSQLPVTPNDVTTVPQARRIGHIGDVTDPTSAIRSPGPHCAARQSPSLHENENHYKMSGGRACARLGSAESSFRLAGTEEEATLGRVRRGSYQVTFAVLVAAIGSYALLQSLVVPVLTTLQAQLHTSQDAATWILTAYLLSASIFTPILGRVGDMIGKERVFVVSLVALAVGSVLAALAPNIGIMIVARVIQGVAGGMIPAAFGIIRDEFPAEKVAGAVGSLASLVAVGSGLGIVLAGPIVSALGWQYLFWLPMIVTIVAAVAAVLFIPESPVRSPGTISWLPAILLSAWLVAILVALSEVPVWGWGSAKTLGLLIGGVVLVAAWVAAEAPARARH